MHVSERTYGFGVLNRVKEGLIDKSGQEMGKFTPGQTGHGAKLLWNKNEQLAQLLSGLEKERLRAPLNGRHNKSLIMRPTQELARGSSGQHPATRAHTRYQGVRR